MALESKEVTLSIVYQKIKELTNLQENDVLTIWVYGSRAYGVPQPNSDWDFVVIVKDSCSFVEPDTREDFINIHFWKESQFRERIELNDLQSLMCVFLPSQFVWKNELTFQVNLSFRRVLRGVHKEASRHFHTGPKRFIQEKEYYKAKKWITYAIRDYLLGLQLIHYGKIIDYNVANQFYYKVIQEQSTDWNYYRETYEPYYNQLKEEFEAAVTLNETQFAADPLKTISFLKLHSISDLWKFLSIKAIYHPSRPWVQLQFLNGESPPNSVISAECNKLIIHSETFQVLALSSPRIFHWNEKKWVPKINLKFMHGFENPIGVFCMLYWSEEEWHVASKYSPDGSNLIEIETQNKVFEKITVKNAFWKIWKELRYLYPENHICLTFKIRLRKSGQFPISNTSQLVLVGAREVNAEKKFPEIELEKLSLTYGYAIPNVIQLVNNSIVEGTKASLLINPFSSCGLILQDKNFLRIRIQSPIYEILCKLFKENSQSEYTLDLLLQLIIRFKEESLISFFLENFPNYSSQFLNIQKVYLQFCQAIQSLYYQIQTLSGDQLNSKLLEDPFQLFKVILFDMKKTQIDQVREYFLRTNYGSFSNPAVLPFLTISSSNPSSINLLPFERSNSNKEGHASEKKENGNDEQKSKDKESTLDSATQNSNISCILSVPFILNYLQTNIKQ